MTSVYNTYTRRLYMSTPLSKRTIPITAPCEGEVTEILPLHRMVEKFEPVAHMTTSDGIETEITTFTSGFVIGPPKVGKVRRGDVIVFVITEKDTVVEEPVSLRRGNILPKPLHQALEEKRQREQVSTKSLEPPTPYGYHPTARTRIINKTISATETQVEGINEIHKQLSEKGIDYSVSELQRAALNMLLSESLPYIVEMVERQRNWEQEGKYGYGARPRNRVRHTSQELNNVSESPTSR